MIFWQMLVHDSGITFAALAFFLVLSVFRPDLRRIKFPEAAADAKNKPAKLQLCTAHRNVVER